MTIKNILRDINNKRKSVVLNTKTNTERIECNCMMCKNKYKIVIGVALFLLFGRIFFPHDIFLLSIAIITIGTFAFAMNELRLAESRFKWRTYYVPEYSQLENKDRL